MAGKTLDPRINAYRASLAAASLRGQVEAEQFTEGTSAQLVASAAPVRREPRFDAPLDTEALLGETVTVYEEREGWSWVQLARDDYVGYLPTEALTRDVIAVTHKVTALRTFVYPEPDIKTPPLTLLSLNAGLSVDAEDGGFLRLGGGGFVFPAHAAPIDKFAPDFVAVAQRFLGTPYLWGGRTSIGVDCSALVQLALEASGIGAPRDTYMQEQVLGEAVASPADPDQLQRGDLIYWPGHVGIVADGMKLLHANAHAMETAMEPLEGALARIAESAGPVRTVRRVGGGVPV